METNTEKKHHAIHVNDRNIPTKQEDDAKKEKKGKKKKKTR